VVAAGYGGGRDSVVVVVMVAAVAADTATNAVAVEMAADGAADANRPKIEDFGCQDV